MSKANVYVFRVCFVTPVEGGGLADARQLHVAAFDADAAIVTAVDALADPKVTAAHVALVERSVVLFAMQRSILADARALEAAALERAS